jgi:autotransporter translocation and assembly factor TamB
MTSKRSSKVNLRSRKPNQRSRKANQRSSKQNLRSTQARTRRKKKKFCLEPLEPLEPSGSTMTGNLNLRILTSVTKMAFSPELHLESLSGTSAFVGSANMDLMIRSQPMLKRKTSPKVTGTFSIVCTLNLRRKVTFSRRMNGKDSFVDGSIEPENLNQNKNNQKKKNIHHHHLINDTLTGEGRAEKKVKIMNTMS